jgi:hypothetical protein
VKPVSHHTQQCCWTLHSALDVHFSKPLSLTTTYTNCPLYNTLSCPSAHLHQKDNRALNGNLRSRKVVCALCELQCCWVPYSCLLF